LGGFLRQVVTDALEDPVPSFARELLGIRGAVRSRRNAIGITIEGDRGHCDDRTIGKPLFEIVVLRVVASAEPIKPSLAAARAMTAVPKKRRRS